MTIIVKVMIVMKIIMIMIIIVVMIITTIIISHYIGKIYGISKNVLNKCGQKLLVNVSVTLYDAI